MTLLQYNNMEKSYLETGKAFEGDIMPDSEEIIAKRVAEEWPHRINTVSTDGSRLDDGKVGGCVAWSDSSGEWIGEKMHQGTNKEMHDNLEMGTRTPGSGRERAGGQVGKGGSGRLGRSDKENGVGDKLSIREKDDVGG
ncbi:hypothetical protein FPQ18DRAFT_394980 [Pyronema domesticum]|nr:hypothetical protein FPQ18DRAFT_394980 [Pyronema domesticum]